MDDTQAAGLGMVAIVICFLIAAAITGAAMDGLDEATRLALGL